MHTRQRTARRWPLLARLTAVTAVCVSTALLTARTAPDANAGGMTPPPPYPCSERLAAGTGAIICHGGRAYPVLAYVVPSWAGSQLHVTTGRCVPPGTVSVVTIPATEWARGARPVNVWPQGC